MKTYVLSSVFILGSTLATAGFAHNALNALTFHGLHDVRAVEENGSDDPRRADLNYCRNHNPVSNQVITITYPATGKDGTAKVTSYPGQPILHPMGLSDKIAFISDAQYQQIKQIVFEMDNDHRHPLTAWVTRPSALFQCVYYGKG